MITKEHLSLLFHSIPYSKVVSGSILVGQLLDFGIGLYLRRQNAQTTIEAAERMVLSEVYIYPCTKSMSIVQRIQIVGEGRQRKQCRDRLIPSETQAFVGNFGLALVDGSFMVFLPRAISIHNPRLRCVTLKL